MMDIITGRVPPLARAESQRSKGSREQLAKTTARPDGTVANRSHGSLVAVVIITPEVSLSRS